MLEAFFLPAAPGERFCLAHAPAREPRGAIVYVHPFAEEMHKSRRMAALQARLLAARGWLVLQPKRSTCSTSQPRAASARA